MAASAPAASPRPSPRRGPSPRRAPASSRPGPRRAPALVAGPLITGRSRSHLGGITADRINPLFRTPVPRFTYRTTHPRPVVMFADEPVHRAFICVPEGGHLRLLAFG